jgi:hypothetical protein
VPIAEFPYFRELPTVLVRLQGISSRAGLFRRLLVDSGFTGSSALVLDRQDAAQVRRRLAPQGNAAGALTGTQQRVWVGCSVPELDFAATVMAISTDLAPLALPEGIDGILGLSFLNRFSQWGAKHSASNDWIFTLGVSDNSV